VYCHVSKDRKKKLEPTDEMRDFVGYIETLHIYQVYFPSLKVTLVRRDVKLDEDKAMGCSLE